jgi:protein-arginine kinase activator protein McsA
MIIVGLQGCKDCYEYFKLHPLYKYIELRSDTNQKSSPEIMEIKKALTKLKFNMKFPVLLSDDLKTLTPREQLIPELNKIKTKKCKHCGATHEE